MQMSHAEPHNDARRPRRLVTAAEVAEFLSVHADTVYRWTREGLLPCRRLGGRSVRYDLDAVEHALLQQAA